MNCDAVETGDLRGGCIGTALCQGQDDFHLVRGERCKLRIELRSHIAI